MTEEAQYLGPKGCPYLGLNEDKTVMLLEASPLHRCYSDPASIVMPELPHQSGYCLTSNFAQCPRFQEAKPATAPPKPPQRRSYGRRSQGGRLPVYIVGALGFLALLAVVGWVMLPFIRPGQDETTIPAASTGTPTVAAVAEASVTPLPAAGEGDQVAVAPSDGETAVSAPPATPSTAVSEQATTPAAATATSTPPPPTSPPDAGSISLMGLVTPTPVAGGDQFNLRPSTGDAGWWKDSEGSRINLNDSYLYAGTLNGENYLAAARFDLSRVPRGAPLLGGELQLTGLREDQMNPAADASWLVQLVGQSELAALGGSSYMMIYSAPAAITLLPQLTTAEVGVGKVNAWTLDATTLQWIEQQRLNGAESVIVRILSSAPAGTNSLFGWDSGLGGTTGGNGPTLRLSVGAAPTVTPPLPTREYIVATFTPVPENVLTVVALQQTATAVVSTIGTFTPVPYFLTPTPFPANLATVQAAARLQGLPAVVLETPVPANAATATADIEYATAVALTTGTFTPVPTGYVTPFRVLPSPPAENLETVVARNVEATAVAASGLPTSTPLPHNAVIAQYVVAERAPENVATAAALAREATAQAELAGTATPTPWEWFVITPTPVPQPTATPTLPIFIAETDFTPTPTPLPGTVEPVPDVLPPEFANKIFFITDRTGVEEVFVLDPATSATGKITRNWVYPLAAQQLAVSPDGTQVAVVKPDSGGVLQIFVRSLEYGTDTQITNFGRDSYDPAWSPTGEWIAFVSTDPGNDEIYRVSPDGAIVQRLTDNKFEWDKHPTWSPDGQQIVFYSNRDTGRRQLWIMNVDGGGQRNLTSDPYENWNPLWTR